ncbi:MAG: hypothetical protein K1X74_19685 [Pirellulales bacterium]|nr:hypothetical protein [Pirellulales bacterium]
MTETQPVRDPSPTAVLSSWVGFCLVPAIVVGDSIVAVARGWSPQTPGSFGAIVYLAAATLALGLPLAVVSRGLRRALARKRTECWAFGAAGLCAWLVAEAALGQLWPWPEFHCRWPNTRYAFEPNLFQMPGVSSKSQVAFNGQGLRGPEWPERQAAYRILCLGDSATECLYIDDQATWTSRLARELPELAGQSTWVGAAAVSEYATAQHLKFLRESPLVDQVDCIVAMVGVNDFLRSLMRLDVRGTPAPLWRRSRLIDLARYDWNGRWQHGYYYDYDGRVLRYRRLGRPIEPFPFDLRKVATEYSARLRAMADAAHARGVRLVFVTQPVLWDDFVGEAGRKRMWFARSDPVPREWTSLDVGNCRETIDEYNDLMLDTGEQTETEVADVAPDLTGWEDNFYDDYHLSERGCALLAQALARYLRDHPPQR